MAAPQKGAREVNRRGLLATVHCARKDLALDEDTYRLVLEQATGKRSAADLTDAELVQIIEGFRQRGWQPAIRKSHKPSDKAHVRKVWALWGDLCKRGALRKPTRDALRSFVKRLTGVSDPEWLTVAQSRRVIESLKVWQQRAAGQQGGVDLE
jgi:phage gp16-like protein